MLSNSFGQIPATAVGTNQNIRLRKVQLNYPIELLAPIVGKFFTGEAKKDVLTCFSNRDFKSPTYIEALQCIFAFPGSSCANIWGSRSALVEVSNGSVEFFRVHKLPQESNNKMELVYINAFRWLEMSSSPFMDSHGLKETLQIPCEPIFICARANNWNDDGDYSSFRSNNISSTFQMKFRNGYIRTNDKSLFYNKLVIHVALIFVVSSIWLLPYLSSIVVAVISYSYALNYVISITIFSVCVILLTPLMLTKSNRTIARHYLGYFFSRTQLDETKGIIRKRIIIFQGIYFSSALVCIATASANILYLYFGIDRHLKNVMLRGCIGLASSWLTFTICRSFERFCRDWAWIVLCICLSQLLNHHLNSIARDEIFVCVLLISFLTKSLIHLILKNVIHDNFYMPLFFNLGSFDSSRNVFSIIHKNISIFNKSSKIKSSGNLRKKSSNVLLKSIDSSTKISSPQVNMIDNENLLFESVNEGNYDDNALLNTDDVEGDDFIEQDIISLHASDIGFPEELFMNEENITEDLPLNYNKLMYPLPIVFSKGILINGSVPMMVPICTRDSTFIQQLFNALSMNNTFKVEVVNSLNNELVAKLSVTMDSFIDAQKLHSLVSGDKLIFDELNEFASNYKCSMKSSFTAQVFHILFKTSYNPDMENLQQLNYCLKNTLEKIVCSIEKVFVINSYNIEYHSERNYYENCCKVNVECDCNVVSLIDRYATLNSDHRDVLLENFLSLAIYKSVELPKPLILKLYYSILSQFCDSPFDYLDYFQYLVNSSIHEYHSYNGDENDEQIDTTKFDKDLNLSFFLQMPIIPLSSKTFSSQKFKDALDDNIMQDFEMFCDACKKDPFYFSKYIACMILSLHIYYISERYRT